MTIGFACFFSICVCVFEYLCVRFNFIHQTTKIVSRECVTTMRARVFLFLLHAFYCLVIVVGLYCTALLCVVVVAVAVAVVGQS